MNPLRAQFDALLAQYRRDLPQRLARHLPPPQAQPQEA